MWIIWTYLIESLSEGKSIISHYLSPTFLSLSLSLTMVHFPPLPSLSFPTAFDMFLVDDRILPMLGRALGKIFFSKKKQPIPLKIGQMLGKGDPTTVAKRIIAAREKTYLYRNHGNCVSIRIAKTNFKSSQVSPKKEGDGMCAHRSLVSSYQPLLLLFCLVSPVRWWII